MKIIYSVLMFGGLLFVGFIEPIHSQAATIILLSSAENNQPPNSMICKAINSTAQICTPIPPKLTEQEKEWEFWFPIVWAIVVLSMLLIVVFVILKF